MSNSHTQNQRKIANINLYFEFNKINDQAIYLMKIEKWDRLFYSETFKMLKVYLNASKHSQ